MELGSANKLFVEEMMLKLVSMICKETLCKDLIIQTMIKFIFYINIFFKFTIKNIKILIIIYMTHS